MDRQGGRSLWSSMKTILDAHNIEDIEDELDAAEWELTLAMSHHDKRLADILNRRTQRLRKQLVSVYETQEATV